MTPTLFTVTELSTLNAPPDWVKVTATAGQLATVGFYRKGREPEIGELIVDQRRSA